jgi:hypothetical protein
MGVGLAQPSVKTTVKKTFAERGIAGEGLQRTQLEGSALCLREL